MAGKGSSLFEECAIECVHLVKIFDSQYVPSEATVKCTHLAL